MAEDLKLSLVALKRQLAGAAVGERAGYLRWFKKTHGDFAVSDQFIGVTVPVLRGLATKYQNLGTHQVQELLRSRIHEHRLVALMILVNQYERGDQFTKQQIFELYLKHTPWINNWDLVDFSAPYILGEHLIKRSRRLLYKLAKSPRWWERRIAILATAAFIERGDLGDTFTIAEQLLADKHDLVRKATGWMLREVGDRSRFKLLRFLKLHYSQLSRTTLRYAIEHLPSSQRRRVLKGVFDPKIAASAV